MLLKEQSRTKQHKPYYMGPWGWSYVVVTNKKQFVLLDQNAKSVSIIPYKNNHMPSALHTYLFDEKKALCYDAADTDSWLLLSFEDNTYQVIPDTTHIGFRFSRMYVHHKNIIVLYNYGTLCFHVFNTQTLLFSVIAHQAVQQQFPAFYHFWEVCTNRGYVNIIQNQEVALMYQYDPTAPICVYEHASGNVTEYPAPNFEFYDVTYRNGLLLVMGEDCLMVRDKENNEAFLYPPPKERNFVAATL